MHATRIIEGIGINILAVLRGHSKHGRNRGLYEILILVIMLNTGNVGVSWSGLFDSRLQQKGFHNFHCLLMKKRYFKISFFFRFWLLFHSCSDVVSCAVPVWKVSWMFFQEGRSSNFS